jgi:hypothetical protein
LDQYFPSGQHSNHISKAKNEPYSLRSLICGSY